MDLRMPRPLLLGLLLTVGLLAAPQPTVQQQVEELRRQIDQTRQQIESLRTDLAAMKNDVDGLKLDMRETHQLAQVDYCRTRDDKHRLGWFVPRYLFQHKATAASGATTTTDQGRLGFTAE